LAIIKHLDRYCAETAFRCNHREPDARLSVLVAGNAGCLPWKATDDTSRPCTIVRRFERGSIRPPNRRSVSTRGPGRHVAVAPPA
jgi:hypothetical protein